MKQYVIGNSIATFFGNRNCDAFAEKTVKDECHKTETRPVTMVTHRRNEEPKAQTFTDCLPS